MSGGRTFALADLEHGSIVKLEDGRLGAVLVATAKQKRRGVVSVRLQDDTVVEVAKTEHATLWYGPGQLARRALAALAGRDPNAPSPDDTERLALEREVRELVDEVAEMRRERDLARALAEHRTWERDQAATRLGEREELLEGVRQANIRAEVAEQGWVEAAEKVTTLALTLRRVRDDDRFHALGWRGQSNMVQALRDDVQTAHLALQHFVASHQGWDANGSPVPCECPPCAMARPLLEAPSQAWLLTTPLELGPTAIAMENGATVEEALALTGHGPTPTPTPAPATEVA